MPKTLYLGLDPSNYPKKDNLIHFPIIKIFPRDFSDQKIQQAFSKIEKITHFIFTSKVAVFLFFEAIDFFQIDKRILLEKAFISIGKGTTKTLKQRGFDPMEAKISTQEGVIEVLKKINGYFFYPRSSLARPQIKKYFLDNKISNISIDLYDTKVNDLEKSFSFDEIDEIIFTSPSCVHAFIQRFGKIPEGKKIISIGPITEKTLLEK